jgi:hypothetical protein
MAAAVVEIAEAVVAELNGSALAAYSFTATRAYTAPRDILGLADLKVTVVPRMLDVTGKDLGPRHWLDWDVGVWIRQRAGRDPEDGDPLMELAEAIVELFRPWRTRTDLRLIRVTCRPPTDPEGLDARGVFTTVVTLTVRVTRP